QDRPHLRREEGQVRPRRGMEPAHQRVPRLQRGPTGQGDPEGIGELPTGRGRMRRMYLLLLLVLAPAFGQGLIVAPDSVVVGVQPGLLPFDTVLLTNSSAGLLRVDSITIRLLDGGANP